MAANRTLSRKRAKLADAPSEGLSEYELKRERNIQRNNAVLEAMGIVVCAEQLMASHLRKAQKVSAATKPSLPCEPSRSSHRLAFRAAAPQHQEVGADAERDLSRAEELLEAREYFASKGQDVPGLEVDGHFTGWVDPKVCEQYGIAPSEEEAALQSRKKGANVYNGPTMAGWSSIRIKSAKELRKNPNAFFYRHVAPHEEQAMGDWTEEEHELFMRTAQEHGVGDKWGLFASHIPRRVGYQCSAYYREVVIPRGLIFDPRFRLTRGGKAVFVG